MKKAILIVGILVAVFAITGTVLVVRAQTSTPETPEDGNFVCPGWDGDETQGNFQGRGMMGRGRGMMGRFSDEDGVAGCGVNGQFGPMHEYVVNALAEATGLTVDQINEKLTNGDTMLQIAKDAGLTEDQITELFTTAHEAAWEAAGVDTSGSFYQNMLERMKNMWSGEGSNSQGQGCRGGFGRGMMRGTNPEF